MDHSGQIDCISVCSGGGGLDLAVELALPGARPVVYVEGEAYACEILVTAMEQGCLATAPIHTNLRTFPGRRFRGCVDGAFGGIPCQPHSEAGLQLGEEDERDLWSAFRRTIVQSGVWWVLIENVGGMLHSGGAERVHRDLRRLGFEVEIGLFTAEECCTEEDGSPSHERERLFILGCRDVADATDDHGRRGERGAETGTREAEFGRRGPPGRGEDLGVGLADPGSTRSQGGGPDGYRPGERPAPERGGGALAEARGVAQVDTSGLGRGEGQPEPDFRSGGRPAGVPGGALADPLGGERDGGPSEPGRRSPGRAPAGRAGPRRIFVPGPDEWGAWGQLLDHRPDLEPAIRRGSDGLAHRVERLRLLGNGVVPVQGGYAIRYLATSLALQGSSGAARLVRLMA